MFGNIGFGEFEGGSTAESGPRGAQPAHRRFVVAVEQIDGFAE